MRNPYAIESAQAVLEVLATVGFVLLIVGILLAAVSLVVRFRRSRGVEPSRSNGSRPRPGFWPLPSSPARPSSGGSLFWATPGRP